MNLLQNEKFDDWSDGLELKFYKVCINDDTGLTMTLFMARSHLVFSDAVKRILWKKHTAND